MSRSAPARLIDTSGPALAPPEGASPLHGHAIELREALVAVLEQGLTLLCHVDAARYREKLPQAFNASVGGHYRHCLDHFEILLRNRDGLLDYDARRRDERTETDPAHARRVTEALLELAEGFDPRDFSATVLARSKVSYLGTNSPAVPSTMAREAMYAVAHAIHHYALIGMMCRLLEVPVPPGFGMAPSTLQHQADTAGR